MLVEASPFSCSTWIRTRLQDMCRHTLRRQQNYNWHFDIKKKQDVIFRNPCWPFLDLLSCDRILANPILTILLFGIMLFNWDVGSANEPYIYYYTNLILLQLAWLRICCGDSPSGVEAIFVWTDIDSFSCKMQRSIYCNECLICMVMMKVRLWFLTDNSRPA